jgi:integrase
MRTVGDVMTWWLSRLEIDRNRSIKYRDNMRSLLKCHVIPHLGKLPITKLDHIALDEMLVWPMHQDLAPRTIQKALQALRQAFAMAFAQGRIAINPMKSASFKDFYLGKLRPKPAALSRTDLPELVKHLVEVFNDNPQKGMLPLMMLAHGTRINETLLSRWAQVSLNERVWVIQEANTKSRRELVLPLTPQVLALLHRYRAALPVPRLKAEWLFSVRGGSRLATTSAHALIREISGGAWTSHDLRKLMRSSLADIGVDYMIGELLINHSLGITAETYLTRDALDSRRDAIQRWHDRLDECGFADAHGYISPVPALVTFEQRPHAARTSIESSASIRGW